MDDLEPDSPKVSIQEFYREQAESLERETLEARMRSLAECREKLERNPQSPEAYLAISRCHRSLAQHQQAIAVLREGLGLCAPSVSLVRGLVNLLEECNRTAEAIEVAREGAQAFPEDLWMKLKEALLLPMLYDTPAEVEFYRRLYAENLRKLCDGVLWDSPEALRSALAAIAGHTNTHLGYQGRDDRALQVQYGEWVHRIMAANFPQWSEPLKMPGIPGDGKLRIGYASSRWRNLSAMKSFFGWLREHSRDRFAVYAYHTGSKTDAATKEVERTSYRFRHVPQSLEQACEAILGDELHVLIHLDIGLEPVMTQLAALRLAPVQCMAWDQPITSGLPTVDHFISRDLAEPENAQEHYSESLVRLPGVGLCYQKPVIPTALLTKRRRDFGIAEEAVVYLCCQYAFKYPPEQDCIYPQIAQRIPAAQFVFLFENQFLESDMRSRLERAFSAAGLAADDHCLLLPAVDRFTYWNLYLLGDVFLDTFGWSGEVSTFEAIACQLPVVTLPGEFMRGRQSYAILTQLGVTETIARDPEEYVQIAARLGLDRPWREDIVQQMSSRHSQLFSDKRCVAALEDFFEQVVKERLGAR